MVQAKGSRVSTGGRAKGREGREHGGKGRGELTVGGARGPSCLLGVRVSGRDVDKGVPLFEQRGEHPAEEGKGKEMWVMG